MTEQCTWITETDDPLLKDAVFLAIECGKISTSILQRRIKVGYGRAARIIDRMEELGFVSASEGTAPRKVLVTRADCERLGLPIPYPATELSDFPSITMPYEEGLRKEQEEEPTADAFSLDLIEKSLMRTRLTEEIEKVEGVRADETDEEEDELLPAAIGVMVLEGKMSTSLLQRRLRIGYGRSARIIDRLEELGFVSPPNGNEPRRVLLRRIEDES